MLLLTVYLLQLLSQRFNIPRMLTGTLCFFAVLLTVKRPVKELLYTSDEDKNVAAMIYDALHFESTMNATYADDRLRAASKEELQARIPVGARLASNYPTGTKNKRFDRYATSLQVALDCDAHYYGQVNDLSADGWQSIKQYGITHFLLWDDTLSIWQGQRPVYQTKNLQVFLVP